MNKPALFLKPLGPALRTNTTQKRFVTSIPNTPSQTTHRKPRHISHQQSRPHLSVSTPHCAHLQQPSSEACEAEDHCFRVSMARRLMLTHPAAPDLSGVATSCPNESARGQICGEPVDAHQHHCYGCLHGGGVDRWHAAAPRYTSSRLFLPSPVCERPGQTVSPRTSMSPFSLPSRPHCCSQHPPWSHSQESREDEI